MKLQELYAVLPEGCALHVYDGNDEEIARYDGRDSIPGELNERVIEVVCPLSGYELGVWAED